MRGGAVQTFLFGFLAFTGGAGVHCLPVHLVQEGAGIDGFPTAIRDTVRCTQGWRDAEQSCVRKRGERRGRRLSVVPVPSWFTVQAGSPAAGLASLLRRVDGHARAEWSMRDMTGHRSA